MACFLLQVAGPIDDGRELCCITAVKRFARLAEQ